ncbi:MAG: autotransporter domain-containing protein [Xanthomonadaceae bacterium]|nr:autotransporter domain-containing protein [Xanthomonadaceae bacterium]MDE3071426.1 autotransporter domain-containing protein [Pseudomonadota bacterium]
MPRTRHLAGAIAASLLFSAAAAATDFSQVFVFGDSLSDNGNISLAVAPGIQPPLRFTTNPGITAIEHVADNFGHTLSPSLLGGTDFAWGGAGVNTNSPGTPSAVPTLTSQVDAYLAGGPASGTALYSIWGGANDIFYHATAVGAGAVAQQLIAANTAGLPPAIAAQVAAQIDAQVLAGAGVSAFETAAQAQANVAAAAQQEVTLIGQLQAAGAKNILVFNLPNIGLTPDATAQGPAAAASLTGLSLIFNGQLNTGLSHLNTGIIPINAYGLLSEVIASPQAYGFANATDPACGAGSSSVQCGPAGSGLPYTYAAGTDQSYVFADGVHPTTAAHALLGQYVISVMQAPGQISLLSESALNGVNVQTHAVRNQMLIDSNGGKTRTFVNIDYSRQDFDAGNASPRTTSNDFNLTLGADVRATDHLSAGLALGTGQSHAYFSGGGGYTLQDITGLGYLTYHAGGGYVGSYFDFGENNFKDVHRSIQLGALQRTESGKPDGSHLGGGLNGGWWFDVEGMRTGPFANVEWQSVKVNGFSENGNDSSAMWFGRQQRDSLLTTLGWRLEGHWNVGNTVLSPYAEVAWNHDNKADPGTIDAGLNSMNGTFAVTGFMPDKTWGTADLGLSAVLTPSVTSWIGYSGRFSDSSQTYNSVNMGVRIKF